MKAFTPNLKPNYTEYMVIIGINVLLGLFLWANSPIVSIPSFTKVLNAYPLLLKEDALIVELISSVKLYLHVIGITCVVSALIAYLSVIPFFKPFAGLVCKLRAMSPIGLVMVFTILASNGYWLKVYIMSFCVVPWLVTSMCGIINTIKQEDFEYAETLRFGHWKTTWHVVIRGQLHQVIEAFRQVAMMGIVMLPVAEKLSKADGGLGFLLSGLERFQTFDKIWAIQIMIICLAIVQDIVIRQIRDQFCPYATMMEEGKK